MTTKAGTGIRQISLVCVPTPDQDKAIEFYESVGFEKRTDTPFGGGYRWVEVYPPEGTAGIALAPPRPGTDVEPVETGITLTTRLERRRRRVSALRAERAHCARRTSQRRDRLHRPLDRGNRTGGLCPVPPAADGSRPANRRLRGLRAAQGTGRRIIDVSRGGRSTVPGSRRGRSDRSGKRDRWDAQPDQSLVCVHRVVLAAGRF